MLLGERLRQLRIRRELTQEHVAAQLDLTEAGYRHWENGRTTPSLDDGPRIANALGIPLFELYLDLGLLPDDRPLNDEEIHLLSHAAMALTMDNQRLIWTIIEGLRCLEVKASSECATKPAKSKRRALVEATG